jgi:hypothetical protein
MSVAPIAERADASTFDYTTVAPDVARSLRTIAATIKRTAVDTIAVIGKHLITAKETLNHGAFIAWVEQECGMKKRTAQDYMAAARFVEGKSATVALLPPRVLYALAAKSTPTEVITDVMVRLDRGEQITEDSIKTLKTVARCEQARDKRQADRNFKRSKAWKQKVASREAKAQEREVAARHRAEVLLRELVATYGTKAIIDIANAINTEFYFLDIARKLSADNITGITAETEAPSSAPVAVLQWSMPTIELMEPYAEIAA